MVSILKGSTSQSLYVEVLDSASTTGGRKTGIAFNAAGLTAYYARNGAAATAITLVTQTAAGAYSSGGWVEVDATNMPGVYRLDVPNTALASGVDSVVVTVKGAAGMVQVSKEVQLTSINLQDAVRMGLTSLPNANAEAAGGLFTRGSGAGQINQPANGRVDTNVVAVAGTTQTARDLGANLDVVVSTRATPAQILVTPANLLATDASGRVTVGSIVNGAIAAATFAANALDAVWSTAARTLTAFGFSVTVATNNDKTGYALTAGEHTSIATDTQTGLTAQGYTTGRAPNLDNLDALMSTRATPAQVKTQVVAALNTDTYAEATAVPAATATLVAKISWLATLARNRITQTSTTQSLRNDADAGNVATSAVSDDGTTFARAKWV